jgi:hypothetical protein
MPPCSFLGWVYESEGHCSGFGCLFGTRHLDQSWLPILYAEIRDQLAIFNTVSSYSLTVSLLLAVHVGYVQRSCQPLVTADMLISRLVLQGDARRVGRQQRLHADGRGHRQQGVS